MTFTNLSKALWLEASYGIGRCYDMSTDSVRPRSDFVPRSTFYRNVESMITPEPDERGILRTDLAGREAYWEAFQYVAPWHKSRDLRMVEFTFVRNGDYSNRAQIKDLSSTPILEARRVVANRLNVAPETLTYFEARNI